MASVRPCQFEPECENELDMRNFLETFEIDVNNRSGTLDCFKCKCVF